MTAPAQATKRFNDLEAWISSGYRNGHPLSEEDYDRLEAERDALIQEHGSDFARRSRDKATGGAYAPPAGASQRRSTGGHQEGRHHRGGPPQSPPQSRQKVASNRRRRAGTQRAGGNPSPSYKSQAAGSLWTDTGLAGGADSISRLAMSTLGLIIGLSLVYLLVSRNGSGVFSTLTRTLSGALDALISPNVDPLQGRPSSAPTTRQAAPAVRGNATQAIMQLGHQIGSGVYAAPKPALTIKPTPSLTLVH